jgi:hypothetical protein
MKKVLAIGDLHCGSMVGLTHPNWMIKRERNREIYDLQVEMWDNFCEALDDIGKVDVLLVNGDIIDGKGVKAGGTEQITVDMLEQTEMAVACIEKIKFNNAIFTYGTPYHTTSKSGEDFDKIVANHFKSQIYDEINFEVDGVLFNAKHKVGSSSSPYNRAVPVGRHRLWECLASLRNKDEVPKVYLRSHVHYFSGCEEKGWRAYTLPALQASMTKFGARQCTGLTDWGLVCFFVEKGQFMGYDSHIPQLKSSKKKVIKF